MKKAITFICIVLCLAVVGCSANKTSNLAKDLDATVKNFVVAVSNLDWPSDQALDKLNNLNKTYENEQTTENSNNQLDTAIDTSEIYTWLEQLHSKINIMLSKRADLLLFINEIHGGNTKLSEADQLSLKVYMNILKDNSNYLSSYTGMIKNQINEALNLYNNKSNINAINAYIIKAVETLQVRSAKIDTSILAMNSIIDIISKNLVNNYFKYNQHTIKNTPIDSQTQPPKEDNTDKTDNDSTTDTTPSVPNPTIPNNKENTETENNNSTIEQTPENNAQNAIDFDSESVEVDGNKQLENKEEDALKSDKEEKIIQEDTAPKKQEQPTNLNIEEDNNNKNNEDEIMPLKGDKKISRETIREKVV